MTEPADVISNDPNAPSVPSGQGKDAYVPMTKDQAESLQRELKESKEATTYWANHARGAGTRQAEAQVDDGPNADEFLDPADGAIEEIAGDTTAAMIDELAAQGLSALTRRGMVTRAEAVKIATEAALKVGRELIGRERYKMSSDDVFKTKFPELKDDKSELWAETSKRYKAAVAMDPRGNRTAAELYLAAEAAREFIDSKGKPAREEEDGGERETEAERRNRADSQDARPRARAHVADDDMLGHEAKQVIAAFGLKDSEFQESRKATGASRGRR